MDIYYLFKSPVNADKTIFRYLMQLGHFTMLRDVGGSTQGSAHA